MARSRHIGPRGDRLAHRDCIWKQENDGRLSSVLDAMAIADSRRIAAGLSTVGRSSGDRGDDAAFGAWTVRSAHLARRGQAMGMRNEPLSSPWADRAVPHQSVRSGSRNRHREATPLLQGASVRSGIGSANHVGAGGDIARLVRQHAGGRFTTERIDLVVDGSVSWVDVGDALERRSRNSGGARMCRPSATSDDVD